jgi:hypothetical protein
VGSLTSDNPIGPTVCYGDGFTLFTLRSENFTSKAVLPYDLGFFEIRRVEHQKFSNVSTIIAVAIYRVDVFGGF